MFLLATILDTVQRFVHAGGYYVIFGLLFAAAGTIRYNFVKFIIADGLGAIVSGGCFLLLGYWAGKAFGDLNALRAKIQHWEHWIFGGIILVVAILIGVAWYRKKQHKP